MGNQYIDVRKEYVERVKRELLGPGSEVCIPDAEHELISSSPSIRYSIGILFPQKQRFTKDNDDATDEEFVTENEAVVAEDDTKQPKKKNSDGTEAGSDPEEDSLDEQIGLAMQNLPSSMGYSFFAKGSCDTLTFNLTFATYNNSKMENCAYPVPIDLPDSYIVPPEASGYVKYDPQYKCLRLASSYKIKDIKSLYERDVLPEDEQAWIINGMYRLYDQFHGGYVRQPHTAEITLNFDSKNYCDTVYEIDEIPVKLTALRRVIKDDVYSITVMLVNPRGNDANTTNPKECLFQPKLRISSENNGFIFADTASYSQYGNDDPEELSNRLLYRKKRVYGYGLGASTAWEISGAGNGWLENEFFPTAEVPSMDFSLDKEKSNVPFYVLSMKQLSDLGERNKTEILSGLRVFVSEYKDWIDELKQQTFEDEAMQKIAALHIKNCRTSYERMVGGIELLESDVLAWDSFRLANRAMYMQRIHLLIQSAMSKEERYDGDETLDTVLEDLEYDDVEPTINELLENVGYETTFKDPTWRPFQLAFLLMSITAMTLDKPKDVNPERDIVDLIWFPTGGGKTEAYLGLTAFTIFHRRMAHKEIAGGTSVIMRYTLRLLAAQQFTRAATLICACEYIRTDSAKGRRAKYPAYDLGNERITIGLWIGGNHTPNRNQGGSKDKPAAKDCLDELRLATIKDLQHKKDRYNKFQVLKCPWCGTKLTKEIVDDHIVGDWGYQMDVHHRFYLKCTNQTCCFHDHKLPIQIVDEELYSAPPTLLFGTVDKFAMMAWKEEVGSFFAVGSDNRAPELIIQDELHLISGPLGTMVAMFETAIDYLCQEKGVRPKIVASTATIRRAKEQCAALYNRDVAQFPSPGLDASDSYFAREAEIDYEKSKYGRLYVGLMPSGKTKAMMEIRTIASLMQCIHRMALPDEIKDKFWTLTTYFGSLRDLGKCRTLAEDDIKDAITRQAQRLGTKQNARRFYSPDELTSRASTTELNETLDKLEKTQYSLENYKKVSHLLLATNMISVGIDVARLNVMLLVGQPKLTSEYIQASSRVGRSFPGVAFTMYDASKSRDRSHFEQFKQYHESFYRYVEPTGATPFSKPARDRSLKALLVAMIRNAEPTLRSEKDASQFTVERYEGVIEKLKSYIVARSISITKRLNPDMLNDGADIADEIDAFFREWEENASVYDSEHFSYGEKFMVKHPEADQGRLLKPFGTDDRNGFDAMTSMRNVDTTVAGNIIVWED